MGAPATEILRTWTDRKGVDCRILRNDKQLASTWAESWYSGSRGEGTGWRVWLQSSEANEILDRLAGEASAISERDALKAERDALKVERDALRSENDSLKKKP